MYVETYTYRVDRTVEDTCLHEDGSGNWYGFHKILLKA